MGTSNVILLGIFACSSLATITIPQQNDIQNTSFSTSCICCNSTTNIPKMLSSSFGKAELSMSIPLTRNLDKLNNLLDLSGEGNDMMSFTPEFARKIADVLYCLSDQPELFPTLTGNVQLEYEEDSGKYLEIEITPDRRMKFFKIDEDGNEYEEDNFKSLDIELIKKEVGIFYGQI